MVEEVEKYIEPHWQERADMCLPACYKMILDDLHRRVGTKNYSMKKISKLCAYAMDAGSAYQDAVDNFNREFKKEKSPSLKVKMQAGISMKLAGLKPVIEAYNTSFPIIPLPTGFLDDTYGLSYSAQSEDWKHFIVVTGIDEEKENVHFVDPWQKYAEKKLGGKVPATFISFLPFYKWWDRVRRMVLWIEVSEIDISKVKQSSLAKWSVTEESENVE